MNIPMTEATELSLKTLYENYSNETLEKEIFEIPTEMGDKFFKNFIMSKPCNIMHSIIPTQLTTPNSVETNISFIITIHKEISQTQYPIHFQVEMLNGKTRFKPIKVTFTQSQTIKSELESIPFFGTTPIPTTIPTPSHSPEIIREWATYISSLFDINNQFSNKLPKESISKITPIETIENVQNFIINVITNNYFTGKLPIEFNNIVNTVREQLILAYTNIYNQPPTTQWLNNIISINICIIKLALYKLTILGLPAFNYNPETDNTNTVSNLIYLGEQVDTLSPIVWQRLKDALNEIHPKHPTRKHNEFPERDFQLSTKFANGVLISNLSSNANVSEALEVIEQDIQSIYEQHLDDIYSCFTIALRKVLTHQDTNYSGYEEEMLSKMNKH